MLPQQLAYTYSNISNLEGSFNSSRHHNNNVSNVGVNITEENSGELYLPNLPNDDVILNASELLTLSHPNCDWILESLMTTQLK